MNHLHVINSLQELESCREQWNEVAFDCPLHRWEWMVQWYKNLGQHLELAILVAIDESGTWQGIAPFCVETTRTRSRKIRFLGSGDACTDYATLICAAEGRQSFAKLVADWLIDGSNGVNSNRVRFDLVELEGVSEDDPMLNILTQRLKEARFTVHESELEGSWVVSLPESWEQLHKTFSKSMRRKTKDAAKRLDAETTRLISSRTSDFRTVWDTFCDLHQRRRAMLGQAGCFACKNFESFLFEATRELAERGLAEIMIIENHGQPLAAMLTYVKDDTLMMYQSGFNPDLQNQSPGYQIVLQAIRNALEQGFTQFDLMRGDEPYKSRWNTRRIPLKSLRLVPPRFSAMLRQNLWASARSFKQCVTQIQTGMSR